MKFRITVFLLALALPSFHAASASADDDFYKGKTIKFFIGSGAGGGYDLFGRLISRHIGAHLPGQPTVTPENMPGSGSVTATNYIYNVAPNDGLSLALCSPSLPLIDALGKSGVRFKVEKLTWLGRVASIINVMVTWQNSPVRTVADARKHEVLISAISATSPLTLLPLVMNATAGTKFKLIRGYADSAATLLAMERGEVAGTTVSWASLKAKHANWMKENRVHILTQFSLSRYHELKDVPAAVETALSPDDKKLMTLFVSGSDVGYAAFTSPGVPSERVALLRRAFMGMIKDPEFRKDANRLGIDLDPMNGEDLQKMIEGMSVFPEAVRARAKEVANAK